MIPVVLLLSWFFLLVRYKVLHFVGVGVCLLGMGCMVGADVLVGRQQGLGKSSSLHGGITAVSRYTLNINPHNNPLSCPLGGVLFHKQPQSRRYISVKHCQILLRILDHAD